MRLLHVVDTIDLKKGGVSQAVRSMASQVFKVGFDNEVLTLDKPGEEDCLSTFQIHNVGPSKGQWGYSKLLVPWLLQNFHRFDVVIVHGLWLYLGFAVDKALKRHMKIIAESDCLTIPKLFFMPHGMLDPYFQYSSDRKLKAVRNWVYWKLIEGKLVNNANGLLFTCKQECFLAKQPFRPYHPKRELIIGLGVEQPPEFNLKMREDFYNVCPQVKESAFILYIGRIDKKKGIQMLIKAYEQLLIKQNTNTFQSQTHIKNYAGIDIQPSIISFPKLVIAGPGRSTVFGKVVKTLVDESDLLKANVFFTGMLESDTKWGAFYSSEAFILPSHQENFGIAVVEALACGKPVLISNQVNISPEIIQERAGIVADDTLDGTYKILNNWLSCSESQRDKMKQQSLICYRKHFSVDSATRRLVNAVL